MEGILEVGEVGAMREGWPLRVCVWGVMYMYMYWSVKELALKIERISVVFLV